MAGKIQNEDVKSLSELTGAGGAAAQLINDTKIYVSANSLNKQLSQAIIDGDIGGVKTYIQNYNAEGGTTGWSTYADAAGTRPVDGTGGSPNVTWTQSASSPLSGSNSFLFTKDAANRQGEGVSYDFSIDSGDQAKVISIDFMYQVASGTFVAGTETTDSDLILYIYDVTNATLIEPIGFKLSQNSGPAVHKATFQTASNSTSYRLIIHVASTSASAYTVKFDNFIVARQAYSSGSVAQYLGPITTTGSWITNTTYSANYWRMGDHLLAKVLVSLAGAPTATSLTINIPSSIGIVDTSKIKFGGDGVADYEGSGSYRDSGNLTYVVKPRYVGSTTSVSVYYLNPTATANTVTQASVSNTAPFTGGNADALEITYRVPILGWESNVQLSNGTDGRLVAARFTGSSTAIGTTNTDIVWGTTDYDTHGAYNASTGVYTVPVAGKYRMAMYAQGAGTAAGNVGDQLLVRAVKNGSVVSNISRSLVQTTTSVNHAWMGQTTVDCVAGDALKFVIIRDATVGALSISSTATAGFGLIEKIASPQFIAQNETVAVIVQKDTGNHTSTGNFQDITTWQSPIKDTHGSFNISTGVFTVPVAGVYSVSGCATLAASGTGLLRRIDVYKNSTAMFTGAPGPVSASNAARGAFAGTINAVAGDTIKVQMFQDSGGNLAYQTGKDTALHIVRVG